MLRSGGVKRTDFRLRVATDYFGGYLCPDGDRGVHIFISTYSSPSYYGLRVVSRERELESFADQIWSVEKNKGVSRIS